MTPPQPHRGDRQVIAVAAAAIVGAVVLPVWRVGVGWPLAALAVVAAILIVRARVPGGRLDGRHWWRLAAGIAALALTTVAALRAAEWLVLTCLIAAAALGSYSLTGGSNWRGLARGLTSLPVAGLSPLVRWRARGRLRSGPWQRVTIGTLCGLILVIVFGALFEAADPAFADLLRDWSGSVPRIGLGFAIVAILALGAVRLTTASGTAEPTTPRFPRRLGLAEWVIPLVMLDALFALFVGTQAPVLFAGDDYVLGRSGPDYADYARDGFAQLAVVTTLTLAVVAALSVLVPRDTPRQRGLLRGLGGVLCVLTLVIVASALTRLSLYTDAYGFNLPRLAGFAAELWLGLIFVLILVAGIRLRAGWLPRTVAAVGTAILLAIAVINPEALMARSHIDRLDAGYPLDLAFLSQLSTDAVDELDALPEPARSCAMREIAARLESGDPWYGGNLSREHARAVIRDDEVLNCDVLPG